MRRYELEVGRSGVSSNNRRKRYELEARRSHLTAVSDVSWEYLKKLLRIGGGRAVTPCR